MNPRIKLFNSSDYNGSPITYFKTFSEASPVVRSGIGIQWSDLVLNEYKFIISAIQANRPVQFKFNLNKLDIVGFNPITFIYANGITYFMLETENYIPGRLTTCQLIKIN